MPVNKIWSVDRLEIIPGKTDIVSSVHWTVSGTDEDGVSAKFSGFTILNSPPKKAISLTKVDEQIAIAWVHEILTEEQIAGAEMVVDQLIEHSKSTKNVIDPPWVGV